MKDNFFLSDSLNSLFEFWSNLIGHIDTEMFRPYFTVIDVTLTFLTITFLNVLCLNYQNVEQSREY
jgi:hypothetical protein